MLIPFLVGDGLEKVVLVGGKSGGCAASEMYPVNAPRVMPICPIPVRIAGRKDEEVARKHLLTGMVAVLKPAFASNTVNQDVLGASFFALSVVEVGHRVVANICQV